MKRNIPFLAAVLMLLISSPVWANDSEYYTQGNQLVPLKESAIRVSKEVLTIDLKDDGCAYVDVYYEFINPASEAKTVLMGFEADPPYPEEFKVTSHMPHPDIKNFSVEINGKKVRYKNAISRQGKFKPLSVNNYWLSAAGLVNNSGNVRIEDFAFVYYFDATFQPGVNKIHHTYSYHLGGSTYYFYFMDYKLTPAMRWANRQIDDFTLIISAKTTAKHFFVGADCLKGIKPQIMSGKGKFRMIPKRDSFGYFEDQWEIALRKGAVRFHKKNYRTTSEFWLHSGVMCEAANTTYDRTFCHADCNVWESMDPGFALRVIHNMPYAHRGHVFKDPQLKQFFESCYWYMPDPNYKDQTKDFTPIDWQYVNYK